MTLGVYLWRLVGTFIYTESQAILGEQTLAIAEAGIEKAIWGLNHDSDYAGETATSFGSGEFTTVVTTLDTNTRKITTTGYIPSASNPNYETTVSIEALSSTTVVNFPYGMQAGQGGITMGNNNTISGGIYSNGTISAANNSQIVGNTWVAGLVDPPTELAFESTNGTSFGNGLQFDGSEDYVAINNNSDYDFGNSENFSIALWFRTDEVNPSETTTLVAKKENTSDSSQGYLIYLDDDSEEVRFRISDGDGSNLFTIRSNTSINNTTEWFHAVFVYDDSSESASKLYINGVDDNATNQTSGNFNDIGDLSNSLDLVFGAESDVSYSSTGHHFDGQIDEVYIYDKALTAQEALDIYNDNATTSNLIGHWGFEEGAGQTTIDTSPKGNNAILGPTTSSENEDPTWSNGAEQTGDSFQFGYTSNLSDIAQSFIAPTSEALNEIDVRLKKTGSPSNLTLRVVEDDSGGPGKNSDQVTSGTLESSWVTTSLDWITVDLSSAPTLTSGQTYWIVLDGGADSSDYYHWSSDTSSGYTGGEAKYSKNWKNKPWNNIQQDLHFRVKLGGSNSSFIGNSGVIVTGDLYAHSIDSTTVIGAAYYETLTNSTATAYYPNSEGPAQLDFPISQAQIDVWKLDAEAGGIHAGDYTTCNAAIGPLKITGNLELEGNCTLTVTGTLWIAGDIDIDNNNTIQLDSDYGGNGGIIVAGGQIALKNSNTVAGSGANDSYVLLVSEYSDLANPAIEFNNSNSQKGIAYAPYGKILLNNSVENLEITGYQIETNNNVSIIHEIGLNNATFSSGTNSAWAMRDGTWEIE